MHRIVRLLHRSGWEFWLPLPLIAGLVWLLGNAIAARVLNRPHESIRALQADDRFNAHSPAPILAINAEIDRSQGQTTVLVRTMDAAIHPLTYEVPDVDPTQIEVAIAQELNTTVAQVRRLTSYRIKP